MNAYYIEIRNTTGTGELVARLENAYNLNYVKQVNAPHILKFCLPAGDAKAVNVTLANEYWLWGPIFAGGAFQVDTFQNDAFQVVDSTNSEVKRKFKLQVRRDVRQ